MVRKCHLELNVRRLLRALPVAPALFFLAAYPACGSVPTDEPVPGATPSDDEDAVSKNEAGLIEKRAMRTKCCTSCGTRLPACITCDGNCSAIDNESVTCNATGESIFCPVIAPQPPKPKCGSAFAGTYDVPGNYYTYPVKDLLVDCVSSGSSLSVWVQANDVPNRFTILDSSNHVVASSAWLGNATYPGAWGSSLSNTGSAILNFTYYSGPYYLQVETVNPSDGSWQDAWNASVSCQCGQ